MGEGKSEFGGEWERWGGFVGIGVREGLVRETVVVGFMVGSLSFY